MKIVGHCCGLKRWPRTLKVVWTGKAQLIVPPSKFYIYHIYGVRENFSTTVFDTPSHFTDEKYVDYLPWIHTRFTQSILCMMFFTVCNKHSTFKLQRTRIQMTQFAIYISDITLAFFQGQSHRTYHYNVDPKQGYNHAKFERSYITGVREKANLKKYYEKIC